MDSLASYQASCSACSAVRLLRQPGGWQNLAGSTLGQGSRHDKRHVPANGQPGALTGTGMHLDNLTNSREVNVQAVGRHRDFDRDREAFDLNGVNLLFEFANNGHGGVRRERTSSFRSGGRPLVGRDARTILPNLAMALLPAADLHWFPPASERLHDRHATGTRLWCSGHPANHQVGNTTSTPGNDLFPWSE